MRKHVPRIFATFLAFVALLSALGALGGALGRGAMKVRDLLETVLLLTPLNLGFAAALAVLAGATARRKRVAFWILVGYFAFLFLLTALLLLLGVTRVLDEPGAPFLARGDVIEVALAALVSVLALNVLYWAHDEFYARVRKGSLRRAIVVFAGVAAVGIGLGYTLVSVFPGSLAAGAEKLRYATDKVLGGFAFTLDVDGRAPGWVNLVLGLFGAVAVFAAMFTLLRSQQVSSELSPPQESRIRGLLTRYGQNDSLGYFATRRDKAAVFAPDDRAAVTYRVVAGVSLASGDPVGDPQAWDAAIEEWLLQARGYGWAPAVMGAGEQAAIAYDRAGLKVLHLGDEAILRADEYTLDGREMRPVRQAVNRVERAGYTASVRRHGDIPHSEMRQIAELATKWRDTEGERGFSMALGRLGDPNDGQCVLVMVHDSAREPKALLSLSPWGTRGLSLDLMRRDHEAENGVMELMVSELMRRAGSLGVDRVSLNFAVFRAVFEDGARIGAGPILRLWRRTLLLLSKWWQLESLYRSNAKYHPQWEPRFLCFAERRELARVSLAAAIAEGFVNLPSSHIPPLDHTNARVLPVMALPDEVVAEDRIPEQMAVRLAKRDRLGDAAYPITFKRTSTCAAVLSDHGDLPPDHHTGEHVSLAGRVMLARNHGKICFATLRDWTGDLQIMLVTDLERWKSIVDIGDHVGVAGEVVTSKRGELTLLVSDWQLTAKCLRPLPDKHSGLTDPEARVRQRYLDLIVNPSSRDLLRTRSAAIRSLRESLHALGFIEVETPILQRIHGGANAKPFTTHINAYDLRLYLRIAPELYLKRLCVGGVEKVFELGRTFRNEGVSYKHNPEFTMLEAYQAYADYDTMRLLTQSLVQNITPSIVHDDIEYDLRGDWPVVTVNDAISAALSSPVTADTSRPDLVALCEKVGVPVDPAWGRGAVILEMYERLVEEKTKQPTFYKDFPADVSPLTRSHRDDPRLAERWDLVAFGSELGTAYSELIDPVEQRRRLTEQSLLAAGGDPEAMELDLDFLEALEHAMPPSGGLGLGVDRLVMLLTGRTIRETLAQPLALPKAARA